MTFNPGDRVIYIGVKFPTYEQLDLTVEAIHGHYLNCRFPEPDRPPRGYGLTTWLEPNDLILA
jgi:hypothetical protein